MHDSRDVGGFARAQRVGIGAVVMGFGAEQHDVRARAFRVAAFRVEGAVQRLGTRMRLDQLAEHRVHPREDVGRGPKVAGQVLRHRSIGKLLGRGEERRDVCPTEPVDRLFGVADEEQSSGLDVDLRPGARAVGRIAGTEQRRDLDLDRIGVLELVDKQAPVSVAQTSTGSGTVLGIAQQCAGEHQEVVELEFARASPIGDCTGGTASERGDNPPDRRVEETADERFPLLSEPGNAFPQAVEVGPLGLAAAVAGTERRLVGAEEAHAFDVVKRGSEPLAIFGELAEARQHRVAVDPALRGGCDHRIELFEPGVDRELGHRGRCIDAVEKVPVVVEDLGDRTQVVQPHAGREHDEDRLLELGIFEQLVDEQSPARLERDTRRDLVAHDDARRQAGFDRELSEDALCERMERADRGGVELLERLAFALFLERAPHPITQLGRGLLGEGDRSDRAHRHAGCDEGDDPVDERRGLPGTGAGLDEQRGVETRTDRISRRRIAGVGEELELVHYSSPSSPSSAR